MWEVRDAQEGEVHPSVRERERGEWDTAAGLAALSLWEAVLRPARPCRCIHRPHPHSAHPLRIDSLLHHTNQKCEI